MSQGLSINAEATAVSSARLVSGQLVADYLDPTQISGISITDANGNAVDDWTITSGSGLKYTASGLLAPGANTPVPEPSGYAFAGLALLGFAAAAPKLRGMIL